MQKHSKSSRNADKSQRLYVTDALGDGETLALAAAHNHYLKNVMRLKPGAVVRLFNGRDGEWRAEITELGRKSGSAVCSEQTRPQDALPDVHYLFAPLKQGRLDYMAQKAAEMGAAVLQPVQTQHTAVSKIKHERMAANVIEAAEQCNLLGVPEVREIMPLQVLLEGWDRERHLIYCDEGAPVSSPLRALGALEKAPLAVLIGPEGGFSEGERDALRGHASVTAISLGPRVMRADTAAVAALALVQAVLGDWL